MPFTVLILAIIIIMDGVMHMALVLSLLPQFYFPRYCLLWALIIIVTMEGIMVMVEVMGTEGVGITDIAGSQSLYL
jgi:hypothetical protein